MSNQVEFSTYFGTQIQGMWITWKNDSTLTDGTEDDLFLSIQFNFYNMEDLNSENMSTNNVN
jgi:hypothetical protein